MSTPPRRPPLDDLEPGPSAARELFQEDAEPGPVTSGPTRPFAEFLRSTPARPLTGTEKALLWVAGIVVGLLFLLSMLKVAA